MSYYRSRPSLAYRYYKLDSEILDFEPKEEDSYSNYNSITNEEVKESSEESKTIDSSKEEYRQKNRKKKKHKNKDKLRYITFIKSYNDLLYISKF